MTDQYDPNQFSEWLTHRMSVLGLRNVDVARAVDVTGPAVSLWRTGINVPDNRRIDELANILQVSPETILIKLGRMQPRHGIPHTFEELITRFQDAGILAERIFFAVGDAVLHVESEYATRQDIVIYLDPLFEPATLDSMSNPILATDQGLLVWQGTCDLENIEPFMMSAVIGAEVDGLHSVLVSAPPDFMDQVEVSLRASVNHYEAYRDGPYWTFEDVNLRQTHGWIVLTVGAL